MVLTPTKGRVPPGELTIATMYGYVGLEARAKLFMGKYPQAKITVLDFSEGGTVKDTQKYRTQVSTQLMSGEGPDIVNVRMMNFPLIA